MKYTHVKCLEDWLKSRLTGKIIGDTYSYYIKDFKCEFCQEKIPIAVEFFGRTFDIINLYRPKEAPYIILESIDDDEINSIHIAKAKHKPQITIVTIYIKHRELAKRAIYK